MLFAGNVSPQTLELSIFDGSNSYHQTDKEDNLFQSIAITDNLKASGTFWFYIFNTCYSSNFATQGQTSSVLLKTFW